MKHCFIAIVSLFLLCGCEFIEEYTDFGNGASDRKIKSERVASFQAIEVNDSIIKGGGNNLQNEMNKYDTLGNIIEHIEFVSGDAKWSTSFFYNEKRLLTYILNCNLELDSCRESILKYDSTGNLVERLNYLFDGTPGNHETHTYSEKSEMVHVYDRKGELLFYNVHEFNDEQLTVSFIRFNPDGTIIFRNAHKYDQNGNMTEMIRYDAAGLEQLRMSRQYNEKNLLTEEIKCRPSGDTLYFYQFDYEYDDYHQWIIKIQFISQVPANYFERHLEYF